MNPPAQRHTLAEAAAQFIGSLPERERDLYRQELNKFVRWYGTDMPMGELTPHGVASYADGLEASTSRSRLEPIRAFLAYARRQGWTSTNLGVHLRLKRGVLEKGLSSEGPAGPRIELTAEGYAKLQAELEQLRKKRPRLAEELHRAWADKDVRENAPLEAAKEQQGQVEARIRELERTLESAVLLNAPVTKHRVEMGSTILLRDLSYNEEMRYTIVDPREVDLAHGKISMESPTGKALLHHQEGDEVEVTAPGGKLRYRIERIEG